MSDLSLPIQVFCLPASASERKYRWPVVVLFLEEGGLVDEAKFLLSRHHSKQVRRINTLTLDDYVTQRGINQIEVLKVEAEGGEPEVLQGARKTLPQCK